ncbi:MAG: glycosyltransferase family 4 protein [Candidatus Omnitrophota bacterium]
MKILFIGHAYVSAWHQEKITALTNYKDIELSLITPTWWEEGLRKVSAAKQSDAPFDFYSVKAFFIGKQYLHFYRGLSRYLKSIDPDILHIEEEPNSVACYQIMKLKKRLKLRAKTVMVTCENIIHTWEFPNPRYFLYPFCQRYTLRNFDHIITSPQRGKEVILNKGFNGPITYIPQLGTNPDKFKKMNADNLREKIGLNGFTIGYAGRLLKMKGLDTLIRAFANIKQSCQLLLVGDGPERLALENLARSLSIRDKIFFVNGVSHEELPLYFNCMDVFVLASERTKNWQEQFGRVLMEAMSCEVPVVGSTCGEIPYTMADAGLLFKEGSEKDLQLKLEEVMENQALRKELARSGRQRVLSHFTHDIIAKKTYEVYCGLLK